MDNKLIKAILLIVTLTLVLFYFGYKDFQKQAQIKMELRTSEDSQ